jgi:hypothetical protein
MAPSPGGSPSGTTTRNGGCAWRPHHLGDEVDRARRPAHKAAGSLFHPGRAHRGAIVFGVMSWEIGFHASFLSAM